jgi:protein-L-isoaspartate(D-aspartate) O-methyltransferase
MTSGGAQPERAPRARLAEKVLRELGPLDPRHLAALLEVARDRFVRPEDVEAAWEDTPLSLDESGLSTISAPHAYMLSFRLAELAPGDRLVELGSGTGYGAALAAFIVGPSGWVVTFEIDAALAARARALLADLPNARVEHADAMSSAPRWGGAKKVICTFAVQELPPSWLDALPEGGRLVAPVGRSTREQSLVRVERRGGQLITTEHGSVRYVQNRSSR